MAGDRDPIANTGLTERLEQHSRRNGFTLGVAMAICMLIGLAGFIYLYTHITILPDFSNKLTTDSPSTRGPAGSSVAGAQRITPPATVRPGTPNANATSVASVPTETPGSTAAAGSAGATGTGTRASGTPTTAFTPNFQIVGGNTINFRSDASRSSGVVKTLPPGTELQFLNQTQEVGGEVWRKLRDRTGVEGWVRDIDLEKIPG